MSDFKTTTLDSSALDPRKRVRYTTGLVMGVDEFQQDQLYMMERDHLHQRSLHGYGVVSGLGIETRQNLQGRWEVVVAPGLAVTPRGQSVCVDPTQCANLDDWLDRHRDELLGSPPLVDPSASPPEPLPLWVVLCPRECETDPVPVLGDPCRTEEDATVPSRIADDFELKLSLEPPEQLEEEAVQRFGDLLRSFVIAESASPFLDQAAVEDLVRGLLPGSPSLSSPPEPLYLPADQAAEILTAAWRVWVTEVRPQLADGAEGCAGGGERCVALGRLDVIVQDNDGVLQTVSADPDVSERPFLLHTRVIQEWLTLALRPPRHGDLLGLDDDDHLQYLLVDPTDRSLIADLDAAGYRVVGLPAAQANGQAVPYEQAVKTGDAAGGDLAGTYRNPDVVRLRGRSLSATAPSNGQVLVWTGSAWTPQGAVVDGDTAGGDLGGTYPNPQVSALRGRSISTNAPTVGQVLVWTGTAWTPQAQSGSGGTPPDLLESDLTRIDALSWTHNGGFTTVTHDGVPVDGIALGFSRPMKEETFSQQTMRVWAQFPSSAQGGLIQYFQIPVPTLLFGEVDDFDLNGRISSVVSGLNTFAVVLVFDPDAWGYLLEQTTGGQDNILHVEVLGDHLLDLDGRSPDVRFVQSKLPTGGPFELGIQGGFFESWFSLLNQEIRFASMEGTVKTMEEEGTTPPIIVPPEEQIAISAAKPASLAAIGDVDFNRATAKDLQTLPGVGPALAKRIVAERKKGGEFTNLEDLRRVSGISDTLIDRLREQQDGES